MKILINALNNSLTFKTSSIYDASRFQTTTKSSLGYKKKLKYITAYKLVNLV